MYARGGKSRCEHATCVKRCINNYYTYAQVVWKKSRDRDLAFLERFRDTRSSCKESSRQGKKSRGAKRIIPIAISTQMQGNDNAGFSRERNISRNIMKSTGAETRPSREHSAEIQADTISTVPYYILQGPQEIARAPPRKRRRSKNSKRNRSVIQNSW